MRNGREIGIKLGFATMCLAGGVALFVAQGGGMTGASVPAFSESIEHAVAPSVTGRISSVQVTLGQKVVAGQMLATIDDRAIRLEQDLAIADLARLEAELAAQEAIQKTEVQEGVLRSSSALADESAARSELASLGAELERAERLRADRLVDATHEAEVRRAFLAATARVKVFEHRRTQLPELYASRGKTQVQAVADARVQPYREAVKARRASLAQLDYQLEQHTLRAPVDGTISLLVHPVGDIVGSGLEVVRLVRSRPGHVVATVPEERARTLVPGMPVIVRATRGVFSEKYPAKVVELGPSVEQLPARSWLSPQWPRWGRRAVIVVEGEVQWQAGEKLYAQF